MECPLCGGPLHMEAHDVFACERGHRLDGEQQRVAAAARVTTALWMAIEALESEAAALHTLAGAGSADGVAELAGQAEEDARLLRRISAAHVPPGHHEGARGRA